MSSRGGQYDSLASILASIENMNQIFKSYIEEQNKLAIEFAKNIDYMTMQQELEINKLKQDNSTDNKDEKTVKKFIDTETVVNGLLSSPLGDFNTYLQTSIQYLRQKQSEKVKDLTKDLLQDLRDSFLIKLAEHQYTINNVIIDVMTSLTLISKNISVTFGKGSANERSSGTKDIDLLEQNNNAKSIIKSEKYNM